MFDYFASLRTGKVVLWCYLIWYANTVVLYFDPRYSIWLNSVGISLVIGFALQLSVTKTAPAPPDYWQTFRLFLMPFCVSSFSSLIKGKGYILVFPPSKLYLWCHIASCIVFVAAVAILKRHKRRQQQPINAHPSDE